MVAILADSFHLAESSSQFLKTRDLKIRATPYIISFPEQFFNLLKWSAQNANYLVMEKKQRGMRKETGSYKGKLKGGRVMCCEEHAM